MTKKQGKKVDMYSLIVLFFLKFDGTINGFQPLVDQVLILVAREKAIRKLLDEQGYGSQGKTLTKAAMRQLMIKAVMKLVKKGYAWALTTGDTEMLKTFGLVEDDFKISQDLLIVLMDEVLKALTDNVLALTPYKVTLVTIGVVQTMEDNFVAAKDIPKQKQALKKAVTTSLSKEIKLCDKTLEICDNLINAEYEDSAPAMVLEYNNDRIVNYGVNRHTMIRAHVYGLEDHSEVIAGACLNIASLNRNEITDIDGMGEIVQFKGGDFVLGIKAIGFVDTEVPFSIKRGKQMDIDVVMLPNILFGHVSFGGKPAVNFFVNIAGTNVSGYTDAFGNFELHGVPDGSGLLESSNEGGDSASIAFVMVNGQKLRVNLVYA